MTTCSKSDAVVLSEYICKCLPKDRNLDTVVCTKVDVLPDRIVEPPGEILRVISKRLRCYYSHTEESVDDADYLAPTYDVLRGCLHLWKKHVLPHRRIILWDEESYNNKYVVVTFPRCKNWLVHRCLLGEDSFPFGRDEHNQSIPNFYGNMWTESTYREILQACVRPYRASLGCWLREKLPDPDFLIQTLELTQTSAETLRHAFTYLPFQVQCDLYCGDKASVARYLSRLVPEEISRLNDEDPSPMIRTEGIAMLTNDCMFDQLEYY